MKLVDFQNNVPEKVGAWETIAEFFKCEVTEQDVWEFARHSEEIPQFHNIYMRELASNIKFHCEDKYKIDDGVIGYYINSLDSHLSVNGDEILSRDDFFGYLAKFLLADVCLNDDSEIEEDFVFGDTTFEVGTPITDVWHHIEEHFNITIGDYLS